MRKTLEQPVFLTALGAASLLFTAFKQPVDDRPDGNAPRQDPGAQPRDAGNRGTGASKPSEIPARGWWEIIKRVAHEISADRVTTEAAAITFFGLLSIFPALAATVSVYGLIADPATIADQVQSLSGVLPGGGIDLLTQQVHKLASAGGGKLGFALLIGIATALWSANQGMKALFGALNVVYDEEEARGFVKLTAITLAFTLGAIVFVVLAMGSVVVLPAVLNVIGFGQLTDLLLRLARWPLLLVVIAVLLALIYRFGPSRNRAQWRWVSWGSAFASVAWVLASAAFSWYVSNFGSYDKTYGSLGAAIGFMTWLWISAIVVLAGAELNAEMEGQTARDTTSGPERARGTRGAVKADEAA